MENYAFCHRQLTKGIAIMVLVIREAAYDAKLLSKKHPYH